MNFKLKFHTSATTPLEPYEIIARIQLELKDKKYTTEYVTDRSILFKDNPWRLRWNFEPLMLDRGEFTISDNDGNERLLSLIYDYSFVRFFIAIAFITIISIFQDDYSGLAFFGVFFGVVIPIDVMRSRGKASELLTAILQADA
jgi:hypothetical protein